MLSARNLTIRRWLSNSFSTRFWSYLIILPSPLVISWRLLYPTSASIRNLLRGRRKPLLPLFPKVFFIFPICRVSDFLIFPESRSSPYSHYLCYHRFVVFTATVDNRAPASFLSFEFSLRLPRSLRESTLYSAIITTNPANLLLVKISSKLVEDFGSNSEIFPTASILG